MIVSVRGTSGSGKTHLARRLMGLLGMAEEVYVEGRKHPVCLRYLTCSVVGHYSTQQGGTDTISGSLPTYSTARESVFGLIRQEAALSLSLSVPQQRHVFYEGLMCSNEVSRTVLIARNHPTHVIFLDTPLAVCLEAINARRVAKGNTEPVSLKKTTEKFEELKRVRFRLKDAGVKTYFLGREDAFNLTCQLLDVTR